LRTTAEDIVKCDKQRKTSFASSGPGGPMLNQPFLHVDLEENNNRLGRF
jgi:hypothetical protein